MKNEIVHAELPDGVRELTDEELNQVVGGVAPVIGAAVAAVGHFTARSMVSSFAGRIGLGLASFELARYFKRR